MARKPVQRTIPSLNALHPGFGGIGKADNQAAALLKFLRDTILRVQPTQPMPFYSMLDVADFCGVSYRTVARAYAKLEAEGLMTRIRGSQTLVLPRRPQPVHPVRGVVGVLIWMPGFLTFGDWRSFFVLLEDALRQRHFAADLIFYRQGEEVGSHFPERVLVHHPDHVIWFCPDVSDRPPMELFRDAGVQLTVLADRAVEFPGRVYRLSWEAALEKGLREWRSLGIQRLEIPVPHGTERPGTSCTHVLPKWLDRLRFAHSFPSLPREDADRGAYVDALGQSPSVGVVFDEDSWYESLCNSAPHAMLRLFRRCRVMIMRRVVFAGVHLNDAFVDALAMDWRDIALRIAHGLESRSTRRADDAHTFHARWCPRAPISQFAQRFRWE